MALIWLKSTNSAILTKTQHLLGSSVGILHAEANQNQGAAKKSHREMKWRARTHNACGKADCVKGCQCSNLNTVLSLLQIHSCVNMIILSTKSIRWLREPCENRAAEILLQFSEEWLAQQWTGADKGRLGNGLELRKLKPRAVSSLNKPLPSYITALSISSRLWTQAQRPIGLSRTCSTVTTKMEFESVIAYKRPPWCICRELALRHWSKSQICTT